MKKKIIYNLIYVIIFYSSSFCNQNWTHIDFDTAMSTKQFPKAIAVTKQVVGLDGNIFLDFCRQLYRKNNPRYLTVKNKPIIPKIIHQIWIGGPVPQAFKQYMHTWTQNHCGPDWEYKLWTDENVKILTLYNRALYEKTDNPGVKSDILKWELIYQFGGVYIDVDFECLKPLDELHYIYDFYTALQPLDTQYVQLGAALFAAKPKHPILKHCIETIKNDWHKKGAPAKTGPIHFTRSFFAMAGKNDSKDIAFPAFYFYPLGCKDRVIYRTIWREKGAFAIHHWAKSWMPPQYRLRKFKNLHNDAETQNWDN